MAANLRRKTGTYFNKFLALVVPVPAFDETRRLHNQLHERASEICIAHAADRSRGLSQIPDLRELRDRLLIQIDRFDRYRDYAAAGYVQQRSSAQ
jgi:hypothetical protein